MALPLANTFEGGSDETVITVGNSGGASGDAFTSTYNPGATTKKFDTARATDGSMSMRIDNAAAGATTLCSWESGVYGTQTEIYGRLYVYRTTGSNDMQIVRVENSGARCMVIELHNSNKIRVWDNTGFAGESTNTIPLDAWTRIEFHLVHSETVGSIEVKFFNLHETTPIETISLTNRNTQAQSNMIHFGQYLTNANAFSAWFDGFVVNNTGYPGPSQTLTLDTVLPDADIVTTGWSTAPLFSKINDDSDATVITATAS